MTPSAVALFLVRHACLLVTVLAFCLHSGGHLLLAAPVAPCDGSRCVPPAGEAQRYALVAEGRKVTATEGQLAPQEDRMQQVGAGGRGRWCVWLQVEGDRGRAAAWCAWGTGLTCAGLRRSQAWANM